MDARDIEDAVDRERGNRMIREEVSRLLTPCEAETIWLLFESELSKGDVANLIGLLSGQEVNDREISEIEKTALAKLRGSEKLKTFFEEN